MARSFNGSSDVITLTATLLAASPGSVAVWFNATSVSGTLSTIYCKQNGNSQQFGMRFNSSKLNGFGDISGLSGATTLTTNKWTHGAFTSTAGGSGVIYLNGVSDATGSIQWSSSIAATNNAIGNDAFNGSRFFPGSLADLAVWNVDLTATEIAGLANGVRPYKIRPTALINYWPLDGLQSPEPDLSGNANNGTLTGTALAFGPPFLPFTPRQPQSNEVAAAAGGVKWEIFMRHGMLPMFLAANPNMDRRQLMTWLALAKDL